MDLKQRLWALVLCCLFLSANLSYALEGTVTKVKDGDTVVISPVDAGRKSFTCRLYGIDTPETSKRGKQGQAYGKEAEHELRNLIYGYRVDVSLPGDKTYNREVCIIRKDGVDINLEMVKRGYAWAYRQYLKRPHASDYIEAEKEARKKGLGLWKQSNPLPPWEFRKRSRR
jgi:endonuclease YncB( thermonuclease family)